MWFKRRLFDVQSQIDLLTGRSYHPTFYRIIANSLICVLMEQRTRCDVRCVACVFKDKRVFHEIESWFFTIFHGFSWFFMDFLDFSWVFLIFHGFSWFFMFFFVDFHGFPWFIMIFQVFSLIFMIFHGFSWVSWFFMMFLDFSCFCFTILHEFWVFLIN